MKNVVAVAAIICACVISSQNGLGQVESSQSIIDQERGSVWVSHSIIIENVPLSTGKQISLSAEYSIRTSSGLCEVFLDRVLVADRSLIIGAVLGESFYRRIYSEIASRHAGTGEYPYTPELTSALSAEPTHVFTRGMMMSWFTTKGSSVISIEPHPSSALCAASYSFGKQNDEVVAKHHSTRYNLKHTQEKSLTEVR